MKRLRDWFQHAFAVNAEERAAPTEQEQAVVDAVCREVVRRHLVTPAVAFLEMSRPLNYLGANAMHYFAPIVNAITDAAGYQHFARFLERRDAIDILSARLTEMESQSS